MKARYVAMVLGVLVAVLFFFNCFTIALLLRLRAENNALRAETVARESSARARPGPRPVRVLSPEEMEAAAVAATQTLSIMLGEVNQEKGLQQVYDTADGITTARQIDGVACRELSATAARQKIYFKAPSSFKHQVPMNARVQVEYYDAAPGGTLYVEFTGVEPYTPSEQTVALKNAAVWQTVEFTLKDALFNGRQKGADFRVTSTSRKVFVRRVTLRRE